jgi:HSP20 family molecular chaperone IbpA
MEIRKDSKKKKALEEILEPVKGSLETELKREILLTPKVNIYETEQGFTLLAAMPGVTKEGINVKVLGDELIIREKVDVNEEPFGFRTFKELTIGYYFRRFRISDEINYNDTKAEMANGLLKVYMPRITEENEDKGE